MSNKEKAHKVEDVNSRSSPLDLSFQFAGISLKFSIISQVLFTFYNRILSLYFRLIVPLQSAPHSLISLIFLFSPILRLHIYPRPVKNPAECRPHASCVYCATSRSTSMSISRILHEKFFSHPQLRSLTTYYST